MFMIGLPSIGPLSDSIKRGDGEVRVTAAGKIELKPAAGQIAEVTSGALRIPAGNFTATLALQIGGAVEGIARNGSELYLTTNGSVRFGARGEGLVIVGANALAFNAAGTNPPDLTVLRDAADTLAQRRGTNAQTHRVYGTFTDASNYEALALRRAGIEYLIEAIAAGTGSSNRNIRVRTGSSGVLLFDIGSTIHARVSAPAAGETALSLYDADNATLERVTVGAADSGGAGFKVLRIPN